MSKKKKKTTIIVIAAICIVIAAAAVLLFLNAGRGDAAAANYLTAQARQGDVEVNVVGSGTSTTAKTISVNAPESGIAGDVAVSLGETVNAGDILLNILPDTDLLTTELEGLEENLEQQEINLSKSKSGYSNYYIKAAAAGTVKQMRAFKGEDAAVTTQSYGALCYISVTGKMQMTVAPPAGVTAETGETVKVSVGSDTLDGTVTGNPLSSLVIELPTDQYDIGASASATKLDGTRLGSGELSLADGIMVTGNGRISKIYVAEGDTVSRGDKLFKTNSYELSKTVEGQQAAVDGIKDNIEELESEMSAVTQVAAAETGIITGISAQTGASIMQNQVLAQIAVTDVVQAVVAIDELDIAKIKTGQSAAVTLDALPDTEYTGTVSGISSFGHSSGGITTYDVTIDLQNPENIRIGMSLSAEISVEKASDVLVIPTDAIVEFENRKMVLLSEYQTAAKANRQTVLSNYLREVETGLANENFVEIVSGLRQGDQVLIETISNDTATGMFRMFNPGKGNSRSERIEPPPGMPGDVQK